MFEFATRWLVCLVLLAVVVQSERAIKNMADNLFEKRQAILVWLFVNVCLAVCTAVVMGWRYYASLLYRDAHVCRWVKSDYPGMMPYPLGKDEVLYWMKWPEPPKEV